MYKISIVIIIIIIIIIIIMFQINIISCRSYNGQQAVDTLVCNNETKTVCLNYVTIL
jgi:hypothetical protein